MTKGDTSRKVGNHFSALCYLGDNSGIQSQWPKISSSQLVLQLSAHLQVRQCVIRGEVAAPVEEQVLEKLVAPRTYAVEEEDLTKNIQLKIQCMGTYTFSTPGIGFSRILFWNRHFAGSRRIRTTERNLDHLYLHSNARNNLPSKILLQLDLCVT